MLDTDREQEKNIWKIICVEELEDYCLSKCIFKWYQSFLNF